MKPYNSLIICAFIFAILVLSCDKKDDKLSTKEMFTSHGWKLSSYKVNEVEQLSIALVDACWTFKNNWTYTIDISYFGYGPISDEWELSLDLSSLHLGHTNQDYTISEISSTKIVIHNDSEEMIFVRC